MRYYRLAYTTQFLIALIAVFVVWDEVGGPYHLDLMPWWLKLALGTGLAYTVVRATASAVAAPTAWTTGTVRWCVVALALLAGCAIANYYCNVYGDEMDDQSESQTSLAVNRTQADAEEFETLSRQARGDSGGWKFNREEIHERQRLDTSSVRT